MLAEESLGRQTEMQVADGDNFQSIVPLLILVLPLFAVAALILRIRFWRSLRLMAEVLAALRGTHVEMSRREMRVFVRLH